MKTLTIKDFKKVSVGVGFPEFYQHFTKDMRQVCLEPCLQGFCIGIYDDEEELIGTKRCTNLSNEHMTFGEEVDRDALEMALKIANEMIAECQDCGGRGGHVVDGYDHRGEHVQRVDKCIECGGTGTVQ